jgi:hypothetical protein
MRSERPAHRPGLAPSDSSVKVAVNSLVILLMSPRRKVAVPMHHRLLSSFVSLLFALCTVAAWSADSAAEPAPTQKFLVHVMPWYAVKPISGHWGWHWTMNHFDPDREDQGRRQIASKLYPTIGPYDSSDTSVLEYHLLLMKLAGVNGIMIDWYGLTDVNDYAQLHRNTTLLIDMAGQLGLEVAICYEDRTVLELERKGLLAQGRAAHAAGEIQWLAEHWFPLGHYLKHKGRPLLLSFGVSNMTDEEWRDALQRADVPVAYVSQAKRRTAAAGVFDWPVPSQGLAAQERFLRSTADEPLAIPVVFPRFDDIYEQAGLHASYGASPDDDGRTFATTLQQAIAAGKPFVQIATWNDWGEGTSIEPSVEYGARDLEHLQQVRRQQLGPQFPYTARNLSLPLKLLGLRKTVDVDAATLDAIALLIAQGNTAEAEKRIAALEDRQ